MSNNPGKKGKPASWIVRERESRAIALERFLEERRPDYAAWRRSRHEKFREIEKLAETRYPMIDLMPQLNDYFARGQAARANIDSERRKKDFIRRHQRTWDKQHPNPLNWVTSRELEAEFAKIYVPVDRS